MDQITCATCNILSVMLFILSRLQSSNHRRFVRPKMRQKPSQGHLRLLMERNDVTSDISPDINSKGSSKVDPNTYSTYMGEDYN